MTKHKAPGHAHAHTHEPEPVHAPTAVVAPVVEHDETLTVRLVELNDLLAKEEIASELHKQLVEFVVRAYTEGFAEGKTQQGV